MGLSRNLQRHRDFLRIPNYFPKEKGMNRVYGSTDPVHECGYMDP
jgi:hypothetical protein